MLRGTSINVLLRMLILLCVFVAVTWAQPHRHQQRCSLRLENALEHVRRRSVQLKASTGATARSMALAQETPYTLYNSFYGQRGEGYDDFYEGGAGIVGGGDGGHRGYFAKRIDHHHRRQPEPPRRRPYDGLLDEEHFGGFEGGATHDGVDAVYGDSGGRREAHKLSVSRVDVEDLRVKLPPPSKAAARWVEVDKCKFSTQNSTLDTRLIFPDLTISGKVVLQPSGGKCQMILRLRHAGIEFHTTPIGFDGHDGAAGGTGGGGGGEESRRGVLGAASVRTDSHFAEPGFISVFAHGCQGPTGIRLRQNSKRRYGFGEQAAAAAAAAAVELSEPQVVLGTGTSNRRWGKYDRRGQAPPPPQAPYYDIRSDGYGYYHHDDAPSADYYQGRGASAAQRRRRFERSAHVGAADQVNFNDDILNFADDELQHAVQPDARAFAEIFGAGGSSAESGRALGAPPANRDDVDEAFTSELERLFSMGVRSLLTTYMQRALQPAIKETLMENMGYTLSYG